ncbi:spermidine N1-acetyltransferase [Deltaproteobacteria bacterium Smac51]|nr:spermidine N1-acetyltransferase [Deltaproteobacteria bacterium Smac51]
MNEDSISLRPLEREDLPFVHGLDNNINVMRYWFEEPYEALVELVDIYEKHIHDQSERRFIISKGSENIGLVELMEIQQIHRNAEFQIIISPEYQGRGYAAPAARLAIEYSFAVLNLYKLYLLVAKENERAIHIYKKLGFESEGVLKGEFYINGRYRDVIRMAIFRDDYLASVNLL